SVWSPAVSVCAGRGEVVMIDPEELGLAHLPRELRREAGDLAGGDDQRLAVYAVGFPRRAKAASTRVAVVTTLCCLALALLMSSPWVAVPGFAACPLIYAAANWNAERVLRARLGVSRTALAACVARFMASPDGAAKAAMLE